MTTWWSSRQAGAHERNAFDQYGRVAKLVALFWGADPRTEQRAPTQEPAPGHNRNVFRPWCPVFALAWLAAPVPFLGCSFPRPGPVCFCSGFFYWPRASRSSSLRDSRRVKRKGIDPRTGIGQGLALSGTPLDVRCSETLAPYIRSIKSAGDMVVCVVTDQMVGDRRSSGATILAVETIYLLRQLSFFSPADRSRTS